MKILPYASYSEPTGDYPGALEAAVALLTVESKRGKGTGFILRKATQEIAWVSRFVWPMLALPVNFPDPSAAGDEGAMGEPRALVFDLCGLASSALVPFRAREQQEGVWSAHTAQGMSATEFVAKVESLAASLRQEQKPLQGALSAVRGLVRRGGSGEEVAGFVSGQPQLARDLLAHLAEPEAPDWQGQELPRLLSVDDARRVADEIADRIRAYIAQANGIESLAGEVTRVGEDYPSQLASMREEVSYRYDGQLDAVRPEVERAVAEHQRSLEGQLNAVMQQYSSTIASHEAELSRADQDVERYRSLGKGYEAQLSEARRVRADAQRRLDAINRERESASKGARDHFRTLIDQENERVNSLLKQRDREIGGLNELERKVEAALRDFRSAASSAATADRKAAADLAALAVPGPVADGGEPIEFGVPLYVARMEGQKATYVVMGPVTMAATRGLRQRVTGFVSGLISGLSLPAETRSSRYDAVLVKAIQQAVEGTGGEAAAGVAASISASAASSNMLADPAFGADALAGLDALKAGGWINDRQYEEHRQAIGRILGGA